MKLLGVLAAASVAFASPASAAEWLFLQSPKGSGYNTVMAVDGSTIVRTGNRVRFVAFSMPDNSQHVDALGGETECGRPDSYSDTALMRVMFRVDYEGYGPKLVEIGREASDASTTHSLRMSESILAVELCNLSTARIVDRMSTDLDAVVVAKLGTLKDR